MRRGDEGVGRDERRSIGPDSGFINALFADAIAQHQRGQLAEAETICRQLLAAEPDHLQGLQLLGVLALRSRRPQEAIELFARALVRAGPHPGLLNNLGLACAAAGHLDEAARHFRSALALAPTFVDALIGLGNTLAGLQRDREAIEQYRRALAHAPDDARILHNLGNALARQGELAEALATYRKACAITPDSVDLLINLGIALKQQEQFDEASQCLQRAVQLRPDHALAHINLANLHAAQGRFDTAIRHCLQALTIEPTSVAAHLNLGYAILRHGRPAEALVPLEAGLAIAPDHPEMQLYLCEAVYLLSLEQPEAALAHAKRLLDRHDGKPLIRRGLAGLAGLRSDTISDNNYSRQLFDQFAPSFDKRLAEIGYLPMARSVVAALDLPQRPEPLDVLDAGCGTGLCAEFLESTARTLTGIDLSPHMLVKARARGSYDRLECSEAAAFMQANAQAFDAIVSSDVLTYIGDAAGFLHAAHYALRPGGKLAVSAEALHRGAADAAEPGFALAPSGRYQHSRAYLEAAFAAAGFQVAKVDEGIMRREAGKPLAAWIVVGEKQSS